MCDFKDPMRKRLQEHWRTAHRMQVTLQDNKEVSLREGRVVENQGVSEHWPYRRRVLGDPGVLGKQGVSKH